MVLADDESLIIGFFYEIMETAAQVCLEPLKLDQKEIEKIYY